LEDASTRCASAWSSAGSTREAGNPWLNHSKKPPLLISPAAGSAVVPEITSNHRLPARQWRPRSWHGTKGCCLLRYWHGTKGRLLRCWRGTKGHLLRYRHGTEGCLLRCWHGTNGRPLRYGQGTEGCLLRYWHGTNGHPLRYWHRPKVASCVTGANNDPYVGYPAACSCSARPSSPSSCASRPTISSRVCSRPRSSPTRSSPG